MSRTWLIDGRGLARKVNSATRSSANQIKDCGANRECPNCHYHIDNSDVSHEWPGFPAGVKFDPSDVELLGHLAAKCGLGNLKPHMFIDEFIPTLEGEEGICYTHPENLPGVKKDGTSVHFFHRTVNAYATGQRKRRKIQSSQHNSTMDHIRWHKTGTTKLIIDNGVQRGYKKIMVLYKASKKGSKPDKLNWAMHQYHLGSNEDENEGQYVVSKIFYQQKKQNDESIVIEESDMGMIQTSPRTPKTSTPHAIRPGKSVWCDDVTDDYAPQSSAQVAELITEISRPSSSTAKIEDDMEYSSWLAGESQAVDGNGINDSLLCDEILDSFAPFDDSGLNQFPFTGYARNTRNVPESDTKAGCGIAELENLEFDTPPDFQLEDLQFGSQDSILGWLDQL